MLNHLLIIPLRVVYNSMSRSRFQDNVLSHRKSAITLLSNYGLEKIRITILEDLLLALRIPGFSRIAGLQFCGNENILLLTQAGREVDLVLH